MLQKASLSVVCSPTAEAGVLKRLHAANLPWGSNYYVSPIEIYA